MGKGPGAGARENFEEQLENEMPKRKVYWLEPPPPSPPCPLKAAPGAGFAKYGCKILRPKGSKGKIFKTKHLTSPFWAHSRRRRCLQCLNSRDGARSDVT